MHDASSVNETNITKSRSSIKQGRLVSLVTPVKPDLFHYKQMKDDMNLVQSPADFRSYDNEHKKQGGRVMKTDILVKEISKAKSSEICPLLFSIS